MTPIAKRTFLILVLGNCLILGLGISLYQGLLIAYRQPIHNQPGRVIPSINRIAHRMAQRPYANWQSQLAQRSRPWQIMTATSTAQFNNKTFDELMRTPPKPNERFSINITPNLWLNVEFSNPRAPYQRWILITVILAWLLALIALSFWAVKRLNLPLKQLNDNLNFANKQAKWQTLPEIGDSEQRAIFAQINQLQQQADKAIKDRTHMLAAISHDLRTPLTRVKLRLDYLKDNEHYAKLVNDVDEIEWMLVETLNYFSDSHQEEINQDFDLVALINAITDDAVDMNYNISFTTDLVKLTFNGKLSLFKRALTNLIDNAIRYGDNAAISLNQSNKTIEIIIEDDGQGLTQEQLAQAVKPYYRAENSRSRQSGGTGLGLTIAKEIIQLHNGSLQLSNRANGGL